MEKTIILDTIGAFNNFNDVVMKHPLVSLIRRFPMTVKPECKMYTGLYGIELSCLGNQGGKLSVIFPGRYEEQKVEPDVSMKHIVVFHHDLVPGTSLAGIIKEWIFSGYSKATSLYLSPQEYQLISAFFGSMESELDSSIDRHSKNLIISHINRILSYCLRFLESQEEMKLNGSARILNGFDSLLNDYFASGDLYEKGVPTVAYFAEQLHHSANYFGNLIKRETGKSAQEYIRDRMIEEAKNKIGQFDKSIKAVSFELGFRYPQHFSRFFKKAIGKTPAEYRQDIQKGDMY